MSVSSPLLGPQSDWCVAYLPLSQGQTHCRVVWPLSGLLAHFQVFAASVGSGVLAGVDLLGAQGWEGPPQLALSLVVHCGRAPAEPGERQTRQRDGSTESQCWVFVGYKQVR